LIYRAPDRAFALHLKRLKRCERVGPLTSLQITENVPSAAHFESRQRCSLTNQRPQQRNGGEEDYEDDRDIKDQLLNPTARFEGCARAWRAKRAAQAGATNLEQDKKNNGYAQNYLNDAYRRKPLLQNSSSLS
jgi:hypothetical protein